MTRPSRRTLTTASRSRSSRPGIRTGFRSSRSRARRCRAGSDVGSGTSCLSTLGAKSNASFALASSSSSTGAPHSSPSSGSSWRCSASRDSRPSAGREGEAIVARSGRARANDHAVVRCLRVLHLSPSRCHGWVRCEEFQVVSDHTRRGPAPARVGGSWHDPITIGKRDRNLESAGEPSTWRAGGGCSRSVLPVGLLPAPRGAPAW